RQLCWQPLAPPLADAECRRRRPDRFAQRSIALVGTARPARDVAGVGGCRPAARAARSPAGLVRRALPAPARPADRLPIDAGAAGARRAAISERRLGRLAPAAGRADRDPRRRTA